jgi:acyl-CoA dehydrogenase
MQRDDPLMVPGGPPIVHHPDVRRMLLSMRASTEAMRALSYLAAAAIDARSSPAPASSAIVPSMYPR